MGSGCCVAARLLVRSPRTRPISQATQLSSQLSANCARLLTPTRRRLPNVWARPAILASAQSSQRSCKAGCISGTAIRKFSSSRPSTLDPLNLIDPLSLKDAGTAPADSLTQIGTNNGLRSTLRTTVAHFALANPDPAVRLEAVQEMSRSLDEPTSRCCASGSASKQIPA